MVDVGLKDELRETRRMIFFAMLNGERVYSLTMPHDDGPVHLPDLAKIGLTGFQSSHPNLSLREHDIVFGFDNRRSTDENDGEYNALGRRICE